MIKDFSGIGSSLAEAPSHTTGHAGLYPTVRLIKAGQELSSDNPSDLHRVYSDPECTKYTSQRTLTEGERWRTMAGLIGHWQIRRYWPYAVEEKSTGRVMGCVGLWYPNDWPGPEIKWEISRSYWSQGFASEAASPVFRKTGG